MSFFKLRSNRNPSEETNPGTTQAQSVESLRKSARHRLIGATVLVLVSVIGFPLIFDTQPRPVKSDIQIEIVERDRVKLSDPFGSVKSPTPPALKGGSNEVGRDVKSEQIANKTSSSTDSVASGAAASAGVGASVGAVGAVSAIAHNFSSSISALTTPSLPPQANQSDQTNSSTKNSSPPATSAVKVPEKTASVSAPPAPAGNEPKEVIISTKASQTKVALALAQSGAENAPKTTNSSAAANASTTPNSPGVDSTKNSPIQSNPSTPATVTPVPQGPKMDKTGEQDSKKESKDSKGSKETKPGKQVIQIGVYTDAAKIKEYRARLEKVGMKTVIVTLTSHDGIKRTRIRVGPFKNQEETQQMLEKIKELKIPGAQLNLIPVD
jgi:DedD protein